VKKTAGIKQPSGAKQSRSAAKEASAKTTKKSSKGKTKSTKKSDEKKKKKLRVLVGSAIWDNLHVILPVTEICVHVWLEMHGHHAAPP
jgi:hypothetical protein